MDSITQAALGAVVGELVLGKKIGWRASAWGLLFGTLPDLDILFLPFFDDAARLHWHRGISHSFFMMALATLLFAKPLSLIHRKRGVMTKEAGWFVFLAWSTHVLIDIFTSYGTQLLEPFSDQRFAFSNLFIIDPLFTLPLLVWCVVIFWRCVRVLSYKLRMLALKFDANPDGWVRFLWGTLETTVIRSSIAKKALCVSCLYVAFSFIMKLWAGDSISRQVAADIPGAKVVAVAPTPLNTLLWRGLIETEEGYFVKFWSPFDRGESSYDFFSKNHALVEPFEGEKMMEALKWSSRGHWVARRGPEGKTVFIDMRFGEMRDREYRKLLPMFQWHLSYDDEGNFEAPSYRPKDLDVSGSLLLIGQRIFGDSKEWERMKAF